MDNEPRVIIAQAHTNDYAALAGLTTPTVSAYCEKHGYDYYYVSNWENFYENDGDRMKVRIFETLYHQKQWDVFVWIDSDAIITNSDLTIDALLTRCQVREDQHFLWGYDVGGPNTGVYIARFTPEALAFLHTTLCRQTEMGWGDNTAMIQVSLVPPHKDIIRCVPGRFLNAYPYELYGWQEFEEVGDWQYARNFDEDFILHLPGIETFPNAEHPERPNRLALFEKYLKECH